MSSFFYVKPRIHSSLPSFLSYSPSLLRLLSFSVQPRLYISRLFIFVIVTECFRMLCSSIHSFLNCSRSLTSTVQPHFSSVTFLHFLRQVMKTCVDLLNFHETTRQELSLTVPAKEMPGRVS